MQLDLAGLAANGRMIPNAPIEAGPFAHDRGVRSDNLGAPDRRAEKAAMHAHLAGARIDGPFAAGSTLSYGGMIKHRLAIADVEHARRAMIYGTLGGYVGITRWDLEPVGAERTRVTFTESSAGPMIALFYGSRRLGEHLERWLSALKVRAER